MGKGKRSFTLLKSLGANLVEVALVIPVLLLVIFFVIDISNYFYRYILISYAAGVGADLACKYPMELRTQSTWCSETGGHVQDCVDYRKFATSVLARTEEIADLVSTPNGVQSSLTRRSFTHYYASSPQDQRILPDQPFITAGAALIRPGEKVRRDDDVEINHSSLAYPNWPLPGTGTSWSALLDKYPVIVRIEAQYTPLTPLLPAVPMAIQGLCYRKTATFGRPPRAYEPQSGPPGGGSTFNATPSASPDCTGRPCPTPWDCSCCYETKPCPPGTDEYYCLTCDYGVGGRG